MKIYKELFQEKIGIIKIMKEIILRDQYIGFPSFSGIT